MDIVEHYLIRTFGLRPRGVIFAGLTEISTLDLLPSLLLLTGVALNAWCDQLKLLQLLFILLFYLKLAN